MQAIYTQIERPQPVLSLSVALGTPATTPHPAGSKACAGIPATAAACVHIPSRPHAFNPATNSRLPPQRCHHQCMLLPIVSYSLLWCQPPSHPSMISNSSSKRPGQTHSRSSGLNKDSAASNLHQHTAPSQQDVCSSISTPWFLACARPLVRKNKPRHPRQAPFCQGHCHPQYKTAIRRRHHHQQKHHTPHPAQRCLFLRGRNNR